MNDDLTTSCSISVVRQMYRPAFTFEDDHAYLLLSQRPTIKGAVLRHKKVGKAFYSVKGLSS